MKNILAPGPMPSASFLPEDYVQKRAEFRANFIILALFGVVMFGVVAAFFVTNQRWEAIRGQQREINENYSAEAAKIEQLKALEGTRADMMNKAEITTALLERVPRSVLLADLVSRMPKDVTVLEMNLTSRRIDPVVEDKTSSLAKGKTVKNLTTPKATPAKAGDKSDKTAKGKTPAKGEEKAVVKAPRFEYTLVITGVAEKNTDISDYLARLGQSDLLEKLELPYIEVAKIDDVEMRKFEIRAGLRSDADVRVARTKAEQAAAQQQAQAAAEAREKAESGALGAVDPATP